MKTLGKINLQTRNKLLVLTQ